MHTTRTNSKGNLQLLVLFPRPGCQTPVFTVLSCLVVRFPPSFTAGNPSEREKRENSRQESHRGTGSTGRDGRVPAQGKRIKGNAEEFRVASTDIFYRKKYGIINQGRTRAVYTDWPEHEET